MSTFSADTLQFPEGWQVEDQTNIHFMNVCGPDWASLDYYLNPWGKIDDGLFEFTTDTCATCAYLALTNAAGTSQRGNSSGV